MSLAFVPMVLEPDFDLLTQDHIKDNTCTHISLCSQRDGQYNTKEYTREEKRKNAPTGIQMDFPSKGLGSKEVAENKKMTVKP